MKGKTGERNRQVKHRDVRAVGVGAPLARSANITEAMDEASKLVDENIAQLMEQAREKARKKTEKARKRAARFEVKKGRVRVTSTTTEGPWPAANIHVPVSQVRERLLVVYDRRAVYDLADALDEFLDHMEATEGWEQP